MFESFPLPYILAVIGRRNDNLQNPMLRISFRQSVTLPKAMQVVEIGVTTFENARDVN